MRLADLLPPDACDEAREWLAGYTDPNKALADAPLEWVEWLAGDVCENEAVRAMADLERATESAWDRHLEATNSAYSSLQHWRFRKAQGCSEDLDRIADMVTKAGAEYAEAVAPHRADYDSRLRQAIRTSDWWLDRVTNHGGGDRRRRWPNEMTEEDIAEHQWQSHWDEKYERAKEDGRL